MPRIADTITAFPEGINGRIPCAHAYDDTNARMYMYVAALSGKEVVLETLAHSPRVFSVYNFMDIEEADQIIEDALGMTQEDYRLKV